MVHLFKACLGHMQIQGPSENRQIRKQKQDPQMKELARNLFDFIYLHVFEAGFY